MPNPWDIGSTKILSGCGFKALATTSGGMAYSLGKRDGSVTRKEALEHCRVIANATDLPVSADLEKGFADRPEDMEQMIMDAAATGVAGCSIEDYSGNPENAIFDHQLAVERIQAACEARDKLGTDFVLTARCEKYLWGEPELDKVIERLQAFEAVGADIVFAPGVDRLQDIETMVKSLTCPVNVVVSTPNLTHGIPELKAIGVRRISIGSSMAQLIFGKVIEASQELARYGTVDFVNQAINYEELESWFG